MLGLGLGVAAGNRAAEDEADPDGPVMAGAEDVNAGAEDVNAGSE